MAATVAVTGATGFVGSHVLTAGRGLIAQISRNGPGHRRAALHDRSALEAAFEGCDVVIHCAASGSSDPAEQERVTVAGTANVVAAARAVGIRRVILLSTTAVYGYGPFTDAIAGHVPLAPASARSAGRVRAEQFLAGSHDVIVRPKLIYGRGDTSFVPALLRTTAQKPTTKMTAAVSVVHVAHLASALLRIATDASVIPREVHVNHPTPVRLGDLVHIARRHQVRVADPTPLPLTAHQQAMLVNDATFTATGRWGAAVGRSPAEPVQLRPEDVSWYRQLLETAG